MMAEEQTMGNLEPRDLLADLVQCHETCLDGLMHSIAEGGDFSDMDHLKILMDCSQICKLAEEWVIRDSEYAGDILSICAIICDDCAESCSEFFNDKHMLICAEVCRSCADSCRGAISDEELEEEEEESEEETKAEKPEAAEEEK